MLSFLPDLHLFFFAIGPIIFPFKACLSFCDFILSTSLSFFSLSVKSLAVIPTHLSLFSLFAP